MRISPEYDFRSELVRPDTRTVLADGQRLGDDGVGACLEEIRLVKGDVVEGLCRVVEASEGVGVIGVAPEGGWVVAHDEVKHHVGFRVPVWGGDMRGEPAGKGEGQEL